MGSAVSSLVAQSKDAAEPTTPTSRPSHIPLPPASFTSFPLESPDERPFHTAPSTPEKEQVPESTGPMRAPSPSLSGISLNPVDFQQGSGVLVTTPPDEAFPAIEVSIDLALDDEGLSTLEKIYLFSRSKATFHRVYICHALPSFLEQVSAVEAVEFVLPLLNGLAMDEDESVKEALASELVPVIWWFYTHCQLVANDPYLDEEEEEWVTPVDPTPVSVQAFTPILGTLLLSPNAMIGGAARHAVVDILGRMRRADVRDGITHGLKISSDGKSDNQWAGNQRDEDEDPDKGDFEVGLFGADERAMFESEILQQVVIGMGRLDGGAEEEGNDDWDGQHAGHRHGEGSAYRGGRPSGSIPGAEELEYDWDGGQKQQGAGGQDWAGGGSGWAGGGGGQGWAGGMGSELESGGRGGDGHQHEWVDGTTAETESRILLDESGDGESHQTERDMDSKENPYFSLVASHSPSGRSPADSISSSPQVFGVYGHESPTATSPQEHPNRDFVNASLQSPSIFRSLLISSNNTRAVSPAISNASFSSENPRPKSLDRATSNDSEATTSSGGRSAAYSAYTNSALARGSRQMDSMAEIGSEASSPVNTVSESGESSSTRPDDDGAPLRSPRARLTRPKRMHQEHSDSFLSQHITHPPGEPEAPHHRPEVMASSKPSTKSRRSSSAHSSANSSTHASLHSGRQGTQPSPPLEPMIFTTPIHEPLVLPHTLDREGSYSGQMNVLHAPIVIQNPFTGQIESIGSNEDGLSTSGSSPSPSSSSSSSPLVSGKSRRALETTVSVRDLPPRPTSPALRPPSRSASPAVDSHPPVRSTSPIPRAASPLRKFAALPSTTIPAPIPRPPSQLSSTFIPGPSEHTPSINGDKPLADASFNKDKPTVAEPQPIRDDAVPTPVYNGGEPLSLTSSYPRDMSAPSYFPSVLHQQQLQSHSAPQPFPQSQPLVSPSSERVPYHYTAVAPIQVDLRTPVFIGGRPVTFDDSGDEATDEEMGETDDMDYDEYDAQAEADAEAEAGEQAAVGRLSSMSLMAAVTASSTLAEDTKRAFVKEVVRIGSDPVYWVRREASFALGALAKVVPEEIVLGSLLPLFESLCQDSVWHVRHSALFALPAILTRLPPSLRRSLALKTLMPLSQDEHAPVRSGVLESLGEAIYTFHEDPDGPPPELLHLFLGRPEDRAVRDGQQFLEQEKARAEQQNSVLLSIFTIQPPTTWGATDTEKPPIITDETPIEAFYKDPARALICAFNYPAVALTLSGSRWSELREIYHQLADNRAIKVRRTLAASLGELAKIIGPDRARSDLMGVWWDSIRCEEEDVRIKAIECVEVFAAALGNGVEQTKVTESLLDVWEEGLLTGWRERESLLHALAGLAAALDASDSRVVRGLLLKGLTDSISAVREAAIYTIPRVWIAFVSRPSVLTALRSDVAGLSTSELHRQRMTYVASQLALVTPLDDGTAAFTPDEPFWIMLRPLADDKTVGVRIGVARLVGFISAHHPPASSVFSSLREHLSQDVASEVRAYIPASSVKAATAQPSPPICTKQPATFATFSRPPPSNGGICALDGTKSA